MPNEPVEQLARILIDKPFPVLRLTSAADGMLELVRERIGRLSLMASHDTLPFAPRPDLRHLRRVEAIEEQDELAIFERMFLARKKLAGTMRRQHGAMTTLRSLDLPGRLERARTDDDADDAWEHGQWIIREGVAKPYADDHLARETGRNMIVDLLARELEASHHLDPAELLTNQIATAISNQLYEIAGDDALLLQYHDASANHS